MNGSPLHFARRGCPIVFASPKIRYNPLLFIKTKDYQPLVYEETICDFLPRHSFKRAHGRALIKWKLNQLVIKKLRTGMRNANIMTQTTG
ncbi:MAG: hypothetical protein DRR16_22175 [Candidatus Parabeggiatoa sp. nov. 3]|nr:MAG: hypothetical protein DRR00_26955 [Gammaproteobacteria bacterium]RKZ59226.1 MAG: hypothetical protein DRQ99_24035 [Gammaproteobacteria bacterium]RKZ81436.1 MAG: hypothetical protein DRR16_22175 [Gammaproteobacteria bacterium]